MQGPIQPMIYGFLPAPVAIPPVNVEPEGALRCSTRKPQWKSHHTPKFPADKYLEHVGFEKFDFFITISDTRFRENDVKLAQEIQKMEKKFYFVRSKIDNDLRAEGRSQRHFNADRTLARIRTNCIQAHFHLQTIYSFCAAGLQQQGVESPQVFLVSNFGLHLYDFYLLHKILERVRTAHKRKALLLAMPNINLEIINKKKDAFHSQIKLFATLSALGAAVPVPGLSVAVDVGLMVGVVKKYIVGFGLDSLSLKSLAGTTGVPLKDLAAAIRSQLAAKEITCDLILKLLESSAALMVAEEWSRYIPIIGFVVAMGLSFITIYRALNSVLNMLAEDAERVFKRVWG
ncbi:interferon-inducible GTPase 5-like [Dicentrarchus labrax]|uniref:interferon-inducible GTPase 5-like n=1 Tax=Dicentrarchus labrax TaxID=13489 RepID=UPI0021F505F9|nr:interferon-inducible GTPase 5-like [Dicentrarchus labrax]